MGWKAIWKMSQVAAWTQNCLGKKIVQLSWRAWKAQGIWLSSLAIKVNVALWISSWALKKHTVETCVKNGGNPEKLPGVGKTPGFRGSWKCWKHSWGVEFHIWLGSETHDIVKIGFHLFPIIGGWNLPKILETTTQKKVVTVLRTTKRCPFCRFCW